MMMYLQHRKETIFERVTLKNSKEYFVKYSEDQKTSRE